MNPEDDDLMAALAEALAEGSDAADIAKVGLELWAWHDPDAALAELTMDSAAEALTGVRATAPVRMLRFSTGRVTIEIELSEGHLRGLAAPEGGTVVLYGSTGARLATAELDATGWFDLTLPPGSGDRAKPVRLRLTDDGGDTWTSWFRL